MSGGGTGADGDERGPGTTAALIGGVFVVVASIVAGIFTLADGGQASTPQGGGVTINNIDGEGNSIGVGSPRTPGSDPSPSPAPPAGPAAAIEAASLVAHGGPLDLSGTVDGLDGRELWVVVHPDQGEGYYLISDGPVAVADGDWDHRDPEVGDETDIGHDVTYLAYAADQDCATFLRETPDDGEGNVFRPTMHESCGSPLASRVVAVI